MERSELLDYLRRERLGVLGTLAGNGQPQGALVGYAVTPQLEILFDTVRTSRKYPNMLANPRVSFTIGAINEKTAQYEGDAEELRGELLERLRPVYYATWTDGAAREQWAGITWFVIHPRWIRFTDYTRSILQEWSF